MFRILVSFRNTEPLLFTTTHYASLDQIEQRFLSPLPWTISTERGPQAIERTDPDLVIIQQFMGNRMIGKRTLTFKESELDPVLEVEEEDSMEENQAITPEVMDKEAPRSVGTLNDETKALMIPAYERFTSFRDTFIRQSTEASSWEDRIVEKHQKYIDSLQRVHGEMDQRLAEAEALEYKIVGK